MGKVENFLGTIYELNELPRITSRQSFLLYLRVMQGLMDASVPLLHDAARRVDDENVYHYFMGHAVEEEGHDRTLREDRDVLGDSVELPDHYIAAIVGAQYYYIRHFDPCMLLGYMLVLEGKPHTLDDVAALEAAFGVEACRTIRHHAEVDPGHRDELLQLIETQNAIVQQKILYNALCTMRALKQCLTERMSET